MLTINGKKHKSMKNLSHNQCFICEYKLSDSEWLRFETDKIIICPKCEALGEMRGRYNDGEIVWQAKKYANKRPQPPPPSAEPEDPEEPRLTEVKRKTETAPKRRKRKMLKRI